MNLSSSSWKAGKDTVKSITNIRKGKASDAEVCQVMSWSDILGKDYGESKRSLKFWVKQYDGTFICHMLQVDSLSR